MNIAVVQETKISRGMHTKLSSGYTIMATDVKESRFGGVALMYKKSKLYELEEAKARGPNITTFELATDTDRYFVVGCYIPPCETTGTTLTTIEQAMAEMPKGCVPLILGDLNVDLANP